MCFEPIFLLDSLAVFQSERVASARLALKRKQKGRFQVFLWRQILKNQMKKMLFQTITTVNDKYFASNITRVVRR